MRKIGSKLYQTFLSPRLELRVRLFNVLAMAGTAVSGFFALFALFTGRWLNLAIAGGGAALAFGLLWYSYRSGQYRRCYIITVVGVFLVMFPAMFFTWGGYKSGLPVFFVFALAFTAFMLDGKLAGMLCALELAVYAGLSLAAYLNPGWVQGYRTELEAMLGITTSFVIVGLSLAVIVRAHMTLYEGMRREVEQARQKLADENAALEELNRLKTEFLANVSHELKTPLTVISGYAQTTRRRLLETPGEQDPGEAADKMQLISSEAERLALMVSQILDVTRIEEGRFKLEKRPCHADEIIYWAVDTHFPILNKNQNRLDIHIQDGLPEIDGDPGHLSQVMVNLIANAIRYTEQGNITVSAENRGGQVAIRVADTGAGITPELQAHLFERYNNHNKPGDGRQTGTGLGLYLCKYVVEAHGGEISVQSAPGRGTAVEFTLPAVAAPG